ncbi:molybdate ABC transporter substrate-binding protein [Rubrivirga sp. IMCC45206]|uniref:molybdate ABC transporter substrate-binding protein n=1 Tax=Rubrivirga sp. IMCC45206 TaxID=3391614 RepID=UPI00398FF623
MTRAAAAALALAVAACAEPPAGPVVFAAASTADVIRAAVPDATISVAASSVLARQIAAGAPAAVLVSADADWVDWLAERVPVLDRRVVASGRLVVVGRADAPQAESLAQAVAGRIAIADDTHVPAGRYARRAIPPALWDRLDRIVTGDVRAALAAVESGAADRAVVYASDAAASARARVVWAFPDTVAVRFEAALLDESARAAFDEIVAADWAGAGFSPR